MTHVISFSSEQNKTALENAEQSRPSERNAAPDQQMSPPPDKAPRYVEIIRKVFASYDEV
jgi:hypothetical protein